jgi:hypothetical protein
MTWPFVDRPDAAWPGEPRQGSARPAGPDSAERPSRRRPAAGLRHLPVDHGRRIGELTVRRDI